MTSTRTCCSVENGSFILGIISSVLSCAALLTLISLIFVISLEVEYSSDGLGRAIGMLYLIVLVAFLLISIVNLMFSVFLSHGVAKKNATHVLMYFVYGIILMVVSVLITLTVTALIEFDEDATPIFWAIEVVYIVVHSLLLWMVHKTYKIYKTGVEHQFDHKKLTEC